MTPLEACAEAGVPVLVLNGDRDPFGIPEGSAPDDDAPEARGPGTGIRVAVLRGETHSLAKDPAAIGEQAVAWLGALCRGWPPVRAVVPGDR